MAASQMWAGVRKSGSPAPKPTTSTPAAFMALALALTARVIEGRMPETRLEICICVLRGKSKVQSLKSKV